MQKLKKTVEVSQSREWSPEHLENVKAQINALYEQQTPIEKLENKIFAIKSKMKDYLDKEDISEIKTVGDFLQDYMTAFKKYLGIPKKDFAAYWGEKGPNLRKYELDERTLTPSLIYKIANTFGTSTDIWVDIQFKNQRLEKISEIDKIEEDQSNEKKYSLEELIRA